MICSYTDIMGRYVDIRIILAAMIIELFLTPIKISGIIPAIILIVFNLIKRGIGSGDILITFVVGIFYGLYDTLQMMTISFAIVFIYGIYIWVFKNKDIKYKIPFVPFIFMGFVIVRISRLIT